MQDKKKLAIVGVLALVIVAVGAFQFLGGGSKPPATTAPAPSGPKPADTSKAVAKNDNLNPFSGTSLPQRDPFHAGTLEPVDPNAPATTTKPVTMPHEPPKFNMNGGMHGTLPPAGGNTQLAPMKVAEPTFGYQLMGVLTGPTPVAVFQDSSGNQRLVKEGGSVDGDSRVTHIADGTVTVQFHDKTLRLKPGGNPSGK